MCPSEQKTHWSISEAEAYCKRIFRHYENFTVGSLFLPSDVRQDLTNIYAFCRYSDDLGDEGEAVKAEERGEALNRLEKWEMELINCSRGEPEHPVFVALAKTIRKYSLPLEPFIDLISAFKQDQDKQEYTNFGELLDYCHRSADPVGRIYLMMFDKKKPEFFERSDKICTALQLTNFWQDVARDLDKERIYVPQEDIEYYNYSKEELRQRKYNENFVKLMAFEVIRTREMFLEGSELEQMVEKRLAFEIQLFRRGGEMVLKKIEAINYDVFHQRPEISKYDKSKIFWQALISRWQFG